MFGRGSSRGQTLNQIMQFEHVIRIKDHVISESGFPAPIHAPEILISSDTDGQISTQNERHMISDVKRYGWDVQTGWSGQYSYSGPIMHPSEYIGGALEDHIMTTDGYWVAVLANMWPYEGTDDPDPAGWLLLHRELNTAEYVLVRKGWGDVEGACTHRVKDGHVKYDGTNRTGCGIKAGHFSVLSRTGESGNLMDITCKREGCAE